MVKELDFPVEVIGCPIYREADGLAMSSRNLMLSADDREHACVLYRSLCAFVAKALQHKHTYTLASIVNDSILEIEEAGGIVDYFAVSDASTLDPVSDFSSCRQQDLVVAAAVKFGNVRLIDNKEFTMKNTYLHNNGE